MVTNENTSGVTKHKVNRACASRGISEDSFWHWLLTVKFTEGGEGLTEGKGFQIRNRLWQLLDEFQEIT